MIESLSVLEIESIARGFVVLDVLVKKSQVTIKIAQPVTPGKFLIIFTGGIAEAEESFSAAIEQAESKLIDSLFLSKAHIALIPAISGQFQSSNGETVAIIETKNISDCIYAADKALKIAPVSLINMQLAKGIGGKGCILLKGELSDVEVALEDIKTIINSEKIVAAEIITRFNQEIEGFFRGFDYF